MTELETVAGEYLRSRYGIVGQVKLLHGEAALNFRVTGDGSSYLLKLMQPDCDVQRVRSQIAALRHVAERLQGVQVQRPVTDLAGAEIGRFRYADESRLAWLTTYLPGRLLVDIRPRRLALMADIGRGIAQLDDCLRDFDPGCDLPVHKWELGQAGWIGEHLDCLESPQHRDWVAAIHERFVTDWLPQLRSLPVQTIHGDANDHNLLVHYTADHRQRLAGVIDFGDLASSPRVADLSIAAAYAVMNMRDPIAGLAQLTAGYHEFSPLSDGEIALLLPLTLTRLAVSVVNSGLGKRLDPDSAYVTISEASAWALLEKLRDVPLDLAEAELRHACGLDPSPHATAIVAIAAQTTAAVLPDVDLDAAPVLDFSFESLLPGDNPETLDLHAFERRIARAMPAGIGVGRYGEPRAVYTSDGFATTAGRPGERRVFHLGVDLFAPAGASVATPLDAIVDNVIECRAPLDYGHVVVLAHTDSAGRKFGTLYGHLSAQVLTTLAIGQSLKAGEVFAQLGERGENGGWPPHLHFQLLATPTWPDNPDGVASRARLVAASALNPNPAAMLGLDPGRIEWRETAVETLQDQRKKHFAQNYSVAYRQPLHVVRGWQHHLYDAQGRRYLDAYNNVPHVGHAHPHVVAAAHAQMRRVSTNTRYLNAGMHRYAERISALLPDPLEVCFFVNSGSEANELALRIAWQRCGARDMLVMDYGYHGNTTGAVAMSPYKFHKPGALPQPDWVHVTPQPDVYRGSHRDDSPNPGLAYAEDTIAVLDRLLEQKRRIAGYISESLPSVGGQIVLPDGFLLKVYAAVRAAGGLCIADDVQTALYRTGRHCFSFARYGVVPDILVLGKPLGNGHPLAAVVTTRAIADSFARGPEFFSTFGGNTVSCAVGNAVLDVLENEGLAENAASMGDILMTGLKALAARHPVIGDVRGAGLFLGVELVRDRETRTPAKAQATYLTNRMRELGILIGTEGPHDNVLKIRPPMTFDSAAAARLLETLGEVLGEDPAQAGFANDPSLMS